MQEGIVVCMQQKQYKKTKHSFLIVYKIITK